MHVDLNVALWGARGPIPGDRSCLEVRRLFLDAIEKMECKKP